MLDIFKQLTEVILVFVKLGVITFPVWIIPIILYFVRKKKYEQSVYYDITKKPYSVVRGDKGFYGEYLTYNYLSSLEGDKRFVFNCYVPKGDGNTTEIDVILIHTSGIFVFESKNYSGWIFGAETQKNWTQTLPTGQKSHKEHFLNPIMQNKSHIKHLRTFIGEDVDCVYHSIIVFSERCTLKNITLTSSEVKVINRYQVLSTVQSIIRSSTKTLSLEEIDMIYNLLYPLTQISDHDKAVHVQNIQSKPSQQKDNFQMAKDESMIPELKDSPMCPQCGSPMLLRKATRGERKGQSFYGCSNYPKCKKIINVNQISNDAERKNVTQIHNSD